jgi:LysR family nitrogen assimilation transcriptional regulator
MPLTLKQLRYFFLVVETGNITRASQALNVAQTAVGLQIRALEQEMGLPLLQRHARGVTPTEAGHLLYREGVAFMARLRELEGRIRSLLRYEIDIRIGLPPCISTMIGPEIAAADQEALPGIRLQIIETVSRSLIELLKQEKVECAFIQEFEPIPDTISIPVFEQRLALVTPPGADRGGEQISFQDALRFPLAFGRNGTSARIVRALAKELGLSVDMRYPVDSISAAKGMVLRGLSASIVPFELVALEAAQGLLDAREIVDPQLRLTTSFVVSNRVADNPSARALLDFLERLICQASSMPGSRTVRLESIVAGLD